MRRHRFRPTLSPLGHRASPSDLLTVPVWHHGPELAYVVKASQAEIQIQTLPDDVFAPSTIGVAAGVGSALTPSGAGLPIMIGD